MSASVSSLVVMEPLLRGRRETQRLRLEVLLESFDAVLASVAALPVAAERRVGTEPHAAVHRHRAGADAASDGLGTVDRRAGHRSRQTVHGVVGDADRVVVAVVLQNAQHGAEDLFLRDGCVRVVIAHPCPPCMQIIDPDGTAAPMSASSRITLADLPPSSRNTFFRVCAPLAMMRFPVAVEPVKLIISTLGSVVSNSPTVAASPDVTTFSTPGGISVCSAAIRPMKVALHGVSGAGLSTTVLPAASAGVILDRLSMNGKFHGVIAPTTPTGSCTTLRELCMPMNSWTGSSRSHS